jgi:hypothetical protein
VDLFDPVTFAAREHVDGRGILAAAAYVGDTRLIDNIEVVSAPRRPSRRRIGGSPAEVGGR